MNRRFVQAAVAHDEGRSVAYVRTYTINLMAEEGRTSFVAFARYYAVPGPKEMSVRFLVDTNDVWVLFAPENDELDVGSDAHS